MKIQIVYELAENGVVSSEMMISAIHDQPTPQELENLEKMAVMKRLIDTLLSAAEGDITNIDTSDLEDIVISSGMMRRLMNRMKRVNEHFQNGNVMDALMEDPGIVMSGLADMLRSQKETPKSDDVSAEEMARRRAIVLPHPDGA